MSSRVAVNIGEKTYQIKAENLKLLNDDADITISPNANADSFVEYHATFCRTQSDASWLAKQFDKTVREACHGMQYALDDEWSVYDELPKIEFVESSVYDLSTLDYVPRKDEEAPTRGSMLAEKELKLHYYKFSNNAGKVFPKPELGEKRILYLRRNDTSDHEPIAAPGGDALKSTAGVDLGAIVEGDEEEEEDTDDDEDEDIVYRPSAVRGGSATLGRMRPDDILATFAHWSFASELGKPGRSKTTFTHSAGTRLVCDLQGSYDTKANVFSLTDPCILYAHTQKGTTEKMYGRTDRGRTGMLDFFDTHTCNALCRHLALKPVVECKAEISEALERDNTLAATADAVAEKQKEKEKLVKQQAKLRERTERRKLKMEKANTESMEEFKEIEEAKAIAEAERAEIFLRQAGDALASGAGAVASGAGTLASGARNLAGATFKSINERRFTMKQAMEKRTEERETEKFERELKGAGAVAYKKAMERYADADDDDDSKPSATAKEPEQTHAVPFSSVQEEDDGWGTALRPPRAAKVHSNKPSTKNQKKKGKARKG
jgi:X-X-X-Leu-X-X-Gly heptad repeat protein